MDFSVLKAKMAEFPGQSHEQIRDALNAKTIPTKKTVSTGLLYLYLMENDLWDGFKYSVAKPVEKARDALELFDPEIDAVNKYALYDALLQGLVDEPTFNFTAQNKADCLAFATSQRSWSDLNWAGDVVLVDLEAAEAYT